MGHGLYLREGKLFLYITARWTDIRLSLQSEKPLELNQWHQVTVTYNGKRKAKYVHLYVNGEEWTKDVIFDELNGPLRTQEPFRIGAGGGPRRTASRAYLDDLRVYERPLTADEAAALAVVETVPEIAAMAPPDRSEMQQTKLRLAFLDRAAAEGAQLALRAWRNAQRIRAEYYDSIPTVMVMEEMEKPRPTHVLERGAYDARGEQVTPGIPAVLGKVPDEFPNNRIWAGAVVGSPFEPFGGSSNGQPILGDTYLAPAWSRLSTTSGLRVIVLPIKSCWIGWRLSLSRPGGTSSGS